MTKPHVDGSSLTEYLQRPRELKLSEDDIFNGKNVCFCPAITFQNAG